MEPEGALWGVRFEVILATLEGQEGKGVIEIYLGQKCTTEILVAAGQV